MAATFGGTIVGLAGTDSSGDAAGSSSDEVGGEEMDRETSRGAERERKAERCRQLRGLVSHVAMNSGSLPSLELHPVRFGSGRLEFRRQNALVPGERQRFALQR